MKFFTSLAVSAIISVAAANSASAAVVTIGFDAAQAGYTPPVYGAVQEITNQFGSLGVVFQDRNSPGRGAIAGVCGPSQGGLGLFGFGADYPGCGSTLPNLDIVFVDPANNANGGFTTDFSIYNFDGLIRATAYDRHGAILGSTQSFTGTLSLAGLGQISRVNLLSLDQDSTTLDTLRFETVQGFASAVPEPQVWALMVAGFGLAGSALRSGRRRLVAA